MELYYSFAILIILASCFSYFNHRFIRLPSSIGIMVIALIFSVFLILFGNKIFAEDLILEFSKLIHGFDFSTVLMSVMLNFLLFAAGIHININDLKEQRWPIIIFSTLSVAITAFLVGGAMYYILPLLGITMPFIYCLIFGTLIAPTDPVAVMGVLKEAKVSKSLETKVAGESLFNDGVAVVMFSIVVSIAKGSDVDISFLGISKLLLLEAGGGILLGFVLGVLGSKMMRKIDDYKISVLITLSVVMGGSMIASGLHMSSPLAMVIAGLIIGNFDKKSEMSPLTKDYLTKFWELIDEILNAILFLFIGFELLVIRDLDNYILPGAIAIFIVLLARYISIFIPAKVIPFKNKFSNHTIVVLCWGGIRGGVSIALALSLVNPEYKNIILSITYIVVIFSIVVQGLTIAKVANKGKLKAESAAEDKIPHKKEEAI